MRPSREGLARAHSVDTDVALLRINKQCIIITLIFFTLSVLGLIKESVAAAAVVPAGCLVLAGLMNKGINCSWQTDGSPATLKPGAVACSNRKSKALFIDTPFPSISYLINSSISHWGSIY